MGLKVIPVITSKSYQFGFSLYFKILPPPKKISQCNSLIIRKSRGGTKLFIRNPPNAGMYSQLRSQGQSLRLVPPLGGRAGPPSSNLQVCLSSPSGHLPRGSAPTLAWGAPSPDGAAFQKLLPLPCQPVRSLLYRQMERGGLT